MVAKHLLLLSFAFVCLSPALGDLTRAKASEKLVAFVDEAVAQLNASPLQIPQFQGASVDVVEDIGQAGGVGRHLCWLKNTEGRVGYVAVAGRQGAFHVIALSATIAPPDYFLKHLQVSELPQRSVHLSQATDISYVEGIPLVGSAQTVLGSESIEISELAASLSSVLNYLQHKRELLLFGHPAAISAWSRSNSSKRICPT